MKKIAVLASGRGSNLQAIIDRVEDGTIPGEIVVVASDKKDAFALERARKHDIEALYLDPNEFEGRVEFDLALAKEIRDRGVDLVVLAGYMRILSKAFVEMFPNQILNIHPALLPSFPGLSGQKDAVNYGVKISGCTVHFVDDQVDHGPIIIQAAVPVLPEDDYKTLASRILKKEHEIFPLAVEWYCRDLITVEDRIVSVSGQRQAII